MGTSNVTLFDGEKFAKGREMNASSSPFANVYAHVVAEMSATFGFTAPLTVTTGAAFPSISPNVTVGWFRFAKPYAESFHASTAESSIHLPLPFCPASPDHASGTFSVNETLRRKSPCVLPVVAPMLFWLYTKRTSCVPSGMATLRVMSLEDPVVSLITVSPSIVTVKALPVKNIVLYVKLISFGPSTRVPSHV